MNSSNIDTDPRWPSWFNEVRLGVRQRLRVYFDKGLPESLQEELIATLSDLMLKGQTTEQIIVEFEEIVGVYKARGIDKWNYSK